MEQKSAPRHHFKPKRPHILGSCLTIFSRSLLLLASVSIWVTGCGPGSTNNNYFDTNKTPNSGASSNFGGGGATGDGGGGQGIECSPEAKNANIRNRLFVRDIYEAIVDKDLKMKSVPGTSGTDEVSDEAIEVLADSLKSYFGPASYSLEFTKASFWKRLVNAIVFLEEDHKLLTSQDANSPIHLQPGCTAVQIAFWDESSGVANEHKLYVNRKFWRSLDQLNKIGLLAHEVFYAQARKAGYKNSDTVRNKVGQLLSQEGLTPLFAAWVPSKVSTIKDVLPASSVGFKTCEGTSQEDPDAKLHMYQYQGKDGKQYFAFPVVASNTINSAYLQSSSFSFDPDTNPELADATDLLYFQSNLNNIRSSADSRSDRFLSRWFSNSILLRPVVDGTVENYLEFLPSRTGTQPILWTDHLRSSPLPITVALLNSTSEWTQKRQRTVRPKKELLADIHAEIKFNFTSCGFNSEAAEAGIALLHKEIKSAIQNGSYPNGFPMWTKLLAQLDAKSKKTTPDRHCDILSNDLIARKYPAYLYSMQLKTDDPQAGIEAFGDDLYTPKSTDSIPNGKMRFSQGSNKLEFDLLCHNYATAYAEKLLSKKSQSTVVVRNTFSNLTEAESDLSVENLNNIERFIALIQSKDERTRNVLFPEFVKRNTPDQNQSFDGPEQYHAFLFNLTQESDIAFDRCDQNFGNDYNAEGVRYKDTNCLIATFQKSKHRFMIYFSYETNPDPRMNEVFRSLPYLEFVQLLPSVD